MYTGIKVRKPRIVVLNNDKIESYVVAIRKNYTNTVCINTFC